MVRKTPHGRTNEFASSWGRDFADHPPLGYVLRENLGRNWTRFHALPSSKRYAETDWDHKIILSRANTLANECFGNEQTVWMVIERQDDFETDGNDVVKEMHMTHVMSWLDQDEDLDEHDYREFWATKVGWKSTMFDQNFTDAADDRYQFILYDTSSSNVLAPYDGGFDIISLRADFLTALEEKYKDWMSDHPDKL